MGAALTMLSRVADSLFWLSRYLERAEHIARVVNVNLNMTLDRTPADAAGWGRLLEALPAPPSIERKAAADVVGRSTVDLANRESIAACVAVARENARHVREEISSEMWEELNRLFLTMQKSTPVTSDWTSGTHEFLSSAMTGVHLIQGVIDATMTHGEGWHFIELGRFVERLTNTAALLGVQFRVFHGDAETPTGVTEYVEWVSVLKSCCAFEAYCRHYTADLRPMRIADFLVLNAEFPRSIRFSAGRVRASLKSVSTLTGRLNGRAERLAGRLTAALDYGQIEEMFPTLPAYLQDIVRQANAIGNAVHQQYVAYHIERELTG
jgi:uncharacterized alpha-E superfamily protein